MPKDKESEIDKKVLSEASNLEKKLEDAKAKMSAGEATKEVVLKEKEDLKKVDKKQLEEGKNNQKVKPQAKIVTKRERR